MAVFHTYTKLAKSLVDKVADLDSDALKVMLLTAYTPGQDTHQFVADVLAVGTEHGTANGYTAGGLLLSGVTFTESGHVYTLDCNDPTWTAVGALTAAYAVFFDSTPGTNATNPVICYWDFGGNVTATDAALTLTIAASGLLTFTAA